MTLRRSIAVVTSSRADWGHLVSPLRALRDRDGVDVQLIVTGAHLASAFGLTVDGIEAAGFEIAARVPCLEDDDTDAAMARTIGTATTGFAEVLDRLRPDLLLVIADRYEMLAPAAAAMAMRIPIAHIEGGEASEGAIDHVVRNALTALAHVHLATTARAAQRVVAAGEQPWRVHHVGCPSLDQLRTLPALPKEALEAQLGMPLDAAPIVAAMHPVTIDRETTREADAFYTALAHVRGPVVFCYPNADAGGRALADRATAFCDARDDARLLVNLEPTAYWTLLRHADLMVGNSSSGIMESASIPIPAVDIGKRQQGRERAANVLHAPANPSAIATAIAEARTPAFRASLMAIENPYGTGHAGERIAEILTAIDLDERLLMKQMTDAP